MGHVSSPFGLLLSLVITAIISLVYWDLALFLMIAMVNILFLNPHVLVSRSFYSFCFFFLSLFYKSAIQKFNEPCILVRESIHHLQNLKKRLCCDMHCWTQHC